MFLLLADVTAKPDITGLPGSNVLQQLVNGAEAWALAVALIGAFIGAALWARPQGGADECPDQCPRQRPRLGAVHELLQDVAPRQPGDIRLGRDVGQQQKHRLSPFSLIEPIEAIPP